MSEKTCEIAIVGAGPAGAHLASRLAYAGRDCVLFDPKGAWEKPCGGGVPSRALREFSFLLESSSYPRKLIRRITMISPLERHVTVEFPMPFAIYSRRVLNGLILDRAIEAGARFQKTAVADFSREKEGWTIHTEDGARWRSRFLVGADGAASFTRRRLIGIFPVCDLALAFGYNIAHDSEGGSPIGSSVRNRAGAKPFEEVVIRFPRNFTGYLWAFPRPGVMNFGVASKLGEKTSTELRELLKGFVSDYYGGKMPEGDRVSFFGAKIPTLDLKSWRGLRACGEGWALVGDAAGFADPITGEGIYYAFKSADLLADVFEAYAGEQYALIVSEYDRAWRDSFGHELEHASYRLPQFYHGTFFGHIFTDAVVRLARYHRGVRTILVRALMGEQSYMTLKRDLMRRAYQIV
ncbi:MAG TPA: NAD(P)/FAD-dependent oxidoreductase [Blastocatellia bacterium]|nr:NAD(P)/FAD-dependent oxidoreductase [Blastocatellia bacterium]